MSKYSYSEYGVTKTTQSEDSIKEIQRLIKNYCDNNYHFGFNRDKPKVRLHEPSFSSEEINKALEVLLSTKVTMGEYVNLFETSYIDLFNFKYGVTSNSGSSANLLAISSMCSPYFEKQLKPGDEVIVSALSWSTTIWPLIQNNLIPVVVDIDPKTLNIDINEIKRAISSKTRAVMPVHVYGNPCDMTELVKICSEHKLLLIEDCCESMGAMYDDKSVGSFGDVSTFSFYFSHHITSLEGGITVTNSSAIADLMKVQRSHGWTRDIDSNKYIDVDASIDPRFTFMDLGYNLRMTEVQAAIGYKQLDRLSNIVSIRRKNDQDLKKYFLKYVDYFSLQEETHDSRSSFFGFIIILKDQSKFTREELCTFLNERNIETRPIICGNIVKQPAMNNYPYRVSGELNHVDNVMRNGLSFGNHHYINHDSIIYIQSVFDEFFHSIGVSID